MNSNVTIAGLAVGAWRYLAGHWRAMLRVSVVPLILMVVISIGDAYFQSILALFVLRILWGLMLATVAVRFYRLLLLDESPAPTNFGFRIGRVEIIFGMFNFIILSFPMFVYEQVVLKAQFETDARLMMAIVAFPVILFPVYWFYRHYPLLPAIALGEITTWGEFRDAVRPAADNGKPTWWRVLVLTMAISAGLIVLGTLPVSALDALLIHTDWLGRFLGAAVAILAGIAESAVITCAYASVGLGGTPLPGPDPRDMEAQ